MFIPAIVAGLVNLILLYLVFRKKIQISIKQEKMINPSDALTDKLGAVLGVFILFSCIVVLSIAPYLNIELWYVSLGFAFILLIILFVRESYAGLFSNNNLGSKKFTFTKTFKRMPISIIPFVLAMFISLEALRIYGVTTDIGNFFNNIITQSATSSVFLWFFFCFFCKYS